jgi:hypothetical protein
MRPVVWQLKNPNDVGEDEHCHSEYNDDCVLRIHLELTLERKPETAFEAILHTDFLRIRVCVYAIVLSSSEQKDQPQEHCHENNVEKLVFYDKQRLSAFFLILSHVQQVFVEDVSLKKRHRTKHHYNERTEKAIIAKRFIAPGHDLILLKKL